MSRYPILISSLALLSALAGTNAAAQQASPTEVKLREQLRATTLQLRTAETERTTLQAAQTQSAEENKQLTAKLDTLTKQAAADQDASAKTVANLNTKIEGKDTEIAQLKEALEKWKKAQTEAAALAAKKESERAQLAQKKIELDRIVADQRTKNAAMYKIGKEVLARYEGFGLGTALTAREPFIGTTRVKLENLVQDLGDKLADERIKPTETSAAEAKPKAEAKPEQRKADRS
jgi:chromosome segregation ATPase